MVAVTAAATFGISAAIALGLWFLLLAGLAAWTRPHLPPAAPETMDLGQEPPAIAAFLTGRWEVPPTAMSGTLVALAARDVVAIEQVAADKFVVRLKGDPPADLTEYERMVHGRVRDVAVNGSAPCEALALGDDEAATKFANEFAKRVVADARQRGVSQSRWTRTTLAPLVVMAAVVGLLAGAAFAALPDTSSSSSSSNDNPVFGVIGIAAIVTFVLMAVVRFFRAERDTPAGREAAARWLGVRRYLAKQGEFGDLPPAAVTIWGPYLAYAAALGLARNTVRALPLGPEDPRRAWSPQGGWHLVRINLPGRLEFGWGKKPLGVLVVSVLAVAFGVFLLIAVGGVFVAMASALRDAWTDVHDAPWWAPFAIFGAIAVVLTIPAVWVGGLIVVGAVQATRAALDLRREEVTGRVVRIRSWQVTEKRSYQLLVVDPGDVNEVRAWAMPLAHDGVERGTTVRATVSPRLGYVWNVTPVAGDAPSAAS
jgi:predicted membrane protein DUF2207